MSQYLQLVLEPLSHRSSNKAPNQHVQVSILQEDLQTLSNSLLKICNVRNSVQFTLRTTWAKCGYMASTS